MGSVRLARQTGTDMAPAEDLNLPVETEEKVEELADAEVAEQVAAELENEETPEHISSTPDVVEVPPQPVLEEAANTLAVTTVESVIESVISESVDTSDGVEAIGVIEETESSNRDSTFLTEIEDTEEIQSENVTGQGSTDKFIQLEKSIEESDKEFHIVESIGENEETKPWIMEESVEEETTSIKEESDKEETTPSIKEESVEEETTPAIKEESVKDVPLSEYVTENMINVKEDSFL